MNNRQTSKRESYKHYIGTSKEDITDMLAELGLNDLNDLYSHISDDVKMSEINIAPGLDYEALKKEMLNISQKNNLKTSFLGDGLQVGKVMDIVPKVAGIRGLSTAYTPYQPERSQGTLQTLWIYQSLISKITGFEAINASLYERGTCLFEALNCSLRIKRKTSKVLVSEGIYPGDIEILNTQARETNLEIIYVPLNKQTGLIDSDALKSIIATNDGISAFAFPQINSFGLIEDFDSLTHIAKENGLLTIAIVDPMALGNTGLKEPSKWGPDSKGADLLVAEGQHLTIGPNYGGPGLGIFGVRYNSDNKNMIRSTAGRFIGKAKDNAGRDCKAIILATREQHIRREKATSNICSNQSFLASLCGASLLNRGSSGLDHAFAHSHELASKLIRELTTFEGVELQFKSAIFNEFTLKIDTDINELIAKASEDDLHIGVNISGRNGINNNLLLVSTNETHSLHDIQKLINFFKRNFKAGSISSSIASIHKDQKRENDFKIKSFETNYLYNYYQSLGEQNLSPDDGIYPLGSCTMKYNPEVNDWAANLEGFTEPHPQAPQADSQGNLEVFYRTQELFKNITGLPALTTQPVAGAQGELVGLKMFQAYHRDRGEADSRNVILIPRSAHGTNPATASMAGFETKKVDGKNIGIITIEAHANGEIDFEHLKLQVEAYKNQIAGIMITNPNTSGIFESKFKDISELIHSVGGLVYMDGANMNAIAGWVDLNKLGVDAVHNNLHKTWSIPHGGGGPGDAIVAVSDKLIDYLPGFQVKKDGENYKTFIPKKTIGSFHRHHGNFAHKVRCLTYLLALGSDGIRQMSAVAVLSARYLYKNLKDTYPILPSGSETAPRMHEFILTLGQSTFERISNAGTPKAHAIARVGKLFLDFGFHAPTVAFPEVYGLMIEPTESYSKSELDEFTATVKTIFNVINEYPQVLQTAPHFTPIDRVDEVSANKTPTLTDDIIDTLDPIIEDRIKSETLRGLSTENLIAEILKAHEAKL